MKLCKLLKSVIIASTVLTLCIGHSLAKESRVSLKDAYAPYFLIGAALNRDQILGRDSAALRVVETHFNSLTAENEMKWESIEPIEGKFNFEAADALMELGAKTGSKIIGHTLLWHNQTPQWVFENSNQKPAPRDVILERLRTHILSIASRYKGQIHGWDVVNEAFNDDGTFRESAWYRLIGPDYIQKAFEFAKEADPEAELYYNDYNLFKPKKREAVTKLIGKLKSNGIQVDAIGIQGHYGFGYPDLKELEESINAFTAAGAKVMFTELDVSVLQFPDEENMGADITLDFELKKELDPFATDISPAAQKEFDKSYRDLFALFLKHEKSITRVTFWGVSDLNSWRNDWPMKGRTDYPLLFDRAYNAKQIVQELITLADEF